jgi:hypothetical protein
MKKLFLFSAIVLCFGAKWLLDNGPLSKGYRSPESLKEVDAAYHGQSLKTYSLGYDNAIAAAIWAQLLQKARFTPVPAGEVSWEAAQLDAITELDPKFERAYEYGAIFVSNFRRDKTGGRTLLEKWVRRRPNYWRANYMLGLHFFLQMNDSTSAGKYILEASRMNHSPEWLSSLGIRLISQTGAFIQSLKIAVEALPEMRNLESKYRMEMRIRSLNYNLQKQALTDALDHYRKEYKKAPKTLAVLEHQLKERRRELASTFSDTELSPEVQELLSEKFEFKLDTKRMRIVAADRAQEKELGQHQVYLPENQGKEEENE